MSISNWKPTRLENPDFTCKNCGSDDVWYAIWESSDGAHEDYKYDCHACNHVWWVEGSDY